MRKGKWENGKVPSVPLLFCFSGWQKTDVAREGFLCYNGQNHEWEMGL